MVVMTSWARDASWLNSLESLRSAYASWIAHTDASLAGFDLLWDRSWASSEAADHLETLSDRLRYCPGVISKSGQNEVAEKFRAVDRRRA